MKKFLYVILSLLLFASCSSRKEIVYFQDVDRIKSFDSIRQFEPRIEVNDVLNINVSSLNDEVVEPFRMDIGNRSGAGNTGNNNASLQGYLVDVDGSIQFPVLGKIKVEGLTRSQLEEDLTRQLREYVTDAVVRVRIVNFKITVLGETGSSVIDVPDERISVPQAIAMAGDVTYDGKRDNILIIRDNNGKLSYGRIDLTSADVFKNPFYYLKQNDIVYVEPTYRKVKSAGFITSWQGIVSIVTTAFGLVVLFTR
ncbi:polysaccharide biosynthesis/export family protein [Salinimicrobium gaetbulicola]|uniref:Polysaccharide biosynthesis/export family protein n=1 Tax=Salinimicrobium gaetbulicola TaxID=999702 RepID=A0ABW3ID93_9FLAO